MAALCIQLQSCTLELGSIFSYVYAITFFQRFCGGKVSIENWNIYLFIYFVVTNIFGLCSSLELQGRRWRANDLDKY